MALEGDEARRLAAVSCRSRGLNVGRSHWLSNLPPDGTATFWCECTRAGCDGLISVRAAEWEEIRGNPGCFFVLPDHADERLGEIVERNERFWAVKLTDERALEVALAQDLLG